MRFLCLISNTLKISLLILFLAGCSEPEKSKSKKLRQANLVIENIHLGQEESFFPLLPPQPSSNREAYPWKNKYIGKHPRITKEFFRCKGHPLNLPLPFKSENQQVAYRADCGGGDRHSLPIRSGKEFIYPLLLDLLNALQEKLGKRVVITSGYRCPVHNIYVDPSKKNRTSKHLIGAAVDFYVEGMEYEPLAIISAIQSCYDENPPISSSPQIWSNREITIRLHKAHEGRNEDNRHAYPYISIEVKYDRDAKQVVQFSWKEAYNGYYRN